MLLQIIGWDYAIGEVTCPTHYEAESSSIAGLKLMKYGFGVLLESLLFVAGCRGWMRIRYTKQ